MRMTDRNNNKHKYGLKTLIKSNKGYFYYLGKKQTTKYNKRKRKLSIVQENGKIHDNVRMLEEEIFFDRGVKQSFTYTDLNNIYNYLT